MRIKANIAIRTSLLISMMVTVTVLSTRLHADTGMCGGANITLPFTDVAAGNVFFCSIAEAFFSGLSNGTSGTTYSPGSNVTREQMAAFVTRSMDQSLKRGSRRAALKRFWTNAVSANLKLTTVGSAPQLVASDGADLWVANYVGNTISRVRASDGKKLEDWTEATHPLGVLVAMGKVFVTGNTIPGALYQIDPSQPPGTVTTVTSSLGDAPEAIAFDGQRIWTTNTAFEKTTGSVSIVTLSPLSVVNVSNGFVTPVGIIYDGANIWITDIGDGKIKKLDSNGNILMSITLPDGVLGPLFPAFDGTNIWVPCATYHLIVMRVTGPLAGTVLATFAGPGNGLHDPLQAAFDGERILVTNRTGNSVSLWQASDLTPLGFFPTGAGTTPFGACSDGLNFWITLEDANKLARF